jgi:hypothetical protein
MKLLSFAINTLSAFGVFMEAACVWLFIAKRQVRKLPFVFMFLTYSLCSDVALVAIQQAMDMWPVLVITTYIGYLFEAAAVWELALTLLDRWHSAAAAHKMRITALGCAFCLFSTYVMTSIRSYGAFGSSEQMYLRVDLTISICRVLALSFVLAMAGKQASGKNRLVVQVAIAFAVYAVCALLKHAFWELAPRWNLPATTFSIADCACSLIWVMLLVNIGWCLCRMQSRGGVSARSCEL